MFINFLEHLWDQLLKVKLKHKPFKFFSDEEQRNRRLLQADRKRCSDVSLSFYWGLDNFCSKQVSGQIWREKRTKFQ